jgi:predicted RNA-binding protein YlxR (DUF448 family)/ribosomal protein L30E
MLAIADPQELDAGPRDRTRPMRQCAVSRLARPASEMIRFVIGPDGEVVADVKRKLPGRGLWIEASRRRIEEGIRRKVFARGFKREVKVPPDLAAEVDRMLVDALGDALAVAAKAGEVAVGFTKAEKAVAEGAAVALIHAENAAPDGVRKLNDAARRAGHAHPPVIRQLSAGKLDLVLGRANVIHAALLAGPAGATFLGRWKRLLQLRELDGGRESVAPEAPEKGQD